MEGENKNMKMKKLTALALAGVLCLGMSTTAFAANSVDPDVADVTIENFEGKLYSNVQNPDGSYDEIENIEIKGYEIADKAAKEDIEVWEKSEVAFRDAVETAAEKIGKTIEKDANLAIVKDVDLQANVNWDLLKEDGVKDVEVTFDVTDLKIDFRTDLSENDTLYLMHYVDGAWVCMETTLKSVDVPGVGKKLYATANFNTTDGMSPVVFVAEYTRGGGNVVVDPEDPTIPVDPEDPTTPADPSNPSINGNGTVTIDDIANAVVRRLQAANTRVVRTSTVASPKTGE